MFCRWAAVAVLLFLCLCDGKNSCVRYDKEAEYDANSKKKWAIVALTRPGRADTRTRNQALVDKLKPFASKHDITMIFFSEMSFPQAVVEGYKKAFQGVAEVKIVNTAQRGFQLPERFGYKYMCKFFSLDMYDFLKEYDFYMRCDTDCYIRKLSFDIFEWAEKNNVGYGFAMRKLEAHGPTKTTLPVWVKDYVNRCDIEPSALMDRELSVCFNFYNNWHLGSVHFFNRPDVRHFLEAVNASGNIFANRYAYVVNVVTR